MAEVDLYDLWNREDEDLFDLNAIAPPTTPVAGYGEGGFVSPSDYVESGDASSLIPNNPLTNLWTPPAVTTPSVISTTPFGGTTQTMPAASTVGITGGSDNTDWSINKPYEPSLTDPLGALLYAMTTQTSVPQPMKPPTYNTGYPNTGVKLPTTYGPPAPQPGYGEPGYVDPSSFLGEQVPLPPMQIEPSEAMANKKLGIPQSAFGGGTSSWMNPWLGYKYSPAEGGRPGAGSTFSEFMDYWSAMTGESRNPYADWLGGKIQVKSANKPKASGGAGGFRGYGGGGGGGGGSAPYKPTAYPDWFNSVMWNF